jgi:hypothetical protein
MTNQEPTPQEQRRFWDLEARRIGLLGLRERADHIRETYTEEELPDEVLDLLEMIDQAYTKAEDAFQYFMLEHPDKSFRVFDPDDIEMAINDEVEPLDLDEPGSGEPENTSEY